MRIAIITEGVSEYKCLPRLYPQLRKRTPHKLMAPTKVSFQPDASPESIAKACKPHVLIAQSKGAETVLILLDREQQSTCPGALASALSAAVSAKCEDKLPIIVVYKDRAFENWLVADLDALRRQPKRFDVTAAIVKQVEPGKADRCNGTALLNKAAVRYEYNKTQDSEKICDHMDLGKALAHSRSLRHFLHALDDPSFAEGCA